MEYAYELALSFWEVLTQMSPFLLFGFFIAGFLSIFISPEWVENHLGKDDTKAVVKTALVGVPLPLCSCGVIPVAASLRKHGASRGATTSFLISTPQTGADSILVTWSLLGPVFAIFRPLVAFVSGIIGGLIVNAFDSEESNPSLKDDWLETSESCDTSTSESSCCSTNKQATSCCGSDHDRNNETITGLPSKIKAALYYGCVTLPADIARPLIVGLFLSGLIAVLIPDDFFSSLIPVGIFQILTMIIVGIPIYICATSSIPVAAALMLKGVSPGAALAFLAAGPATNAATIATIWKVLGRRTAIIFLAVVIVTSILSGLAIDNLFDQSSLNIPEIHHHEHNKSNIIGNISALFLIAILINAAFQNHKKRFIHSEVTLPTSDQHNETSPNVNDKLTSEEYPIEAIQRIVFNISGMTCSHCSSSVTRTIKEIPGVKSVLVDHNSGLAEVSGSNLDIQVIFDAVTSLGYKPSRLEHSS